MRSVVLALAASSIPTARGVWKNLTVFHTNQANYSAADIADMNTADDLVRPHPAGALERLVHAGSCSSTHVGRCRFAFVAARRTPFHMG